MTRFRITASGLTGNTLILLVVVFLVAFGNLTFFGNVLGFLEVETSIYQTEMDMLDGVRRPEPMKPSRQRRLFLCHA
jgi:hypothetical protein